MTTTDSRHQRRLLYNQYVRYLFIAAAVLMSLLIASIIFFVGRQGLMTFAEVSPMDFFLGAKWSPSSGSYGALSFISGSFFVTVLSVLLGAPLGILGALFMAKIAPQWMLNILQPALQLYVAIPSVVYGYIGLVVLIPFLQSTFNVRTGFGILSASIILAIMILPTILSLSDDALRGVPASLGEASLALGATWWQTLRHIIVPAALPGILTSIVLAMARAIGETMAVQMLIGNTPLIANSLLTPTTSLTSNIVVEMGNTMFGSAWSNALFLMAFVLMLLSLGMILMIRRLGQRRMV
jgi:phosphate transport system permease protein